MRMAGAAWRSSRHTVLEEAEVRLEEGHHDVHLGEGRGTGDTAQAGAEDQAAEDRDRWRLWATQRSCLALVSGQLAVGCPGQRTVRTTVDICRELAGG